MKSVYSQFPAKIPPYAAEIFEFESSFLQSVLHGINHDRPNFLSFLDPQVHNHSLPISCLPLLYTAALMKLGISYAQASLLTCFMNIFSAIVFLFSSTFFYTRHIHAVALCFAFNSGWAFFRSFLKSNVSNDLVHDIGRWTTAPWFQTLAVFLTLSKTASATIPMALLALTCAFYSNRQFANSSNSQPNESRTSQRAEGHRRLVLGGLAATLIPSAATSIAFFFAVSNFIPSFLLFSPSIIPKLLNVKLSYQPLWREYQMQGYFYSQLLIFYDAFGPAFFAIFLFPLTKPSADFLHKFFSALSALLMLSFFREGNGHWANSLAITCVFFPFLLSVFIHSLDFVRNHFKKPQYRGMAFAFDAAVIAFYVWGGAICLSRIANRKTFVKGPDEFFAKIVNAKIPKGEPIFCAPMKMNPVGMLTGHPIFIGNPQMLWNWGAVFDDVLMETARVNWEKNASAVMDKYGYKYAIEYINNQFITKQPDFLQEFRYVNYTDEWALVERIQN